MHMKQKMFDLCEYIIAVVLILNCRSIWVTIPKTGNVISHVLLFALIFACMGCICTKSHLKLKHIKSAVVGCCGISIYLLLYILMSGYNRIEFILWVLAIDAITLYYITCKDEGNIRLLIKYKNIVVGIAVISMIIWFSGSLMHIININCSVETNWTSTNIPKIVSGYFGIQYEMQSLSFMNIFTVVVRNSSFFAEAPMASFNFSTALLIEVFLSEKKSRLKFIILFLANLSTLSTAGIMIDFVCVAVLFFKKKTKNSLLRVIKIFAIPLSIIVLLIVGYILIGQKLNDSSGLVRLDDFASGFKAWITSPILGHGYENNDILKRYMSIWRRNNMGFSNSLMQILAQGGLYIAIPYIGGFAIGIYDGVKSKDINKAIFLIGFTAIFIITVVSYTYIVYMVIIYSVCSSEKNRRVRIII